MERLAAAAAAEEEAKRKEQEEEERKLAEEEEAAAAEEAAASGPSKDAKKGKKEEAAPPATGEKKSEVEAPAQEEKQEQEKEQEKQEEPDLYDNIDDDFKPVLMELWHSASDSYKKSMLKTFGAMRGRREIATESFKDIQINFLKYLNRDDDKQSLLNKFIEEFNDFTDQRADMREDQETKDELHQRADTLCDQMASIIEQRKEQNIEERKKVIACGWFESEMEKVVVNAAELMQTEVDRFRSSQSLLVDYYHAIQGKLVPGLPQSGIISDVAVPNLIQIAQADEQPLSIEVLPAELSTESEQRRTALLIQNEENGVVSVSNAVAYPRLDKIYERALRAQLPLQQKVQAPKGGKGAGAAGKKGDKKAAAVQEEGDKEPSKYDNELKQGLTKERELLRWRLTLIRNWTLQKIRAIRLKAEDVFIKFDDWARVAIKAQTDAVVSLSMILKEAIEGQTKLQEELRISKMDFEVDSGIANFIEPPPEPHPPRQLQVSGRFSIPVLSQLVSQLKSIAGDLKNEELSVIQAKDLLDAFIKLKVQE